jgi:putative transposase
VGRQRVQRLMQQHGIRARGQRRFRVVTTDSGHDLPIAPHLLNRNFTVQAPNRTWSGDITYIPTEEGWLFLAVVIDLFSRRVVGWSMREDLHRSLVDALEMGWFRRRPRKGELIFHSDRGSQYASEDFRQVLDRHGIRAWMSRRGNCWDNAVTETLFGSLKVERLHGERFLTLRQAKDAVLAWLLWYNQQRMHSTLNYVSPAQYEQQWSQARPGRGTDPGNRLRRFPHFHRHHHDGNMIPLTRSLRDTHSEGKISMCFLLWGEPGGRSVF